MVELNKRMAVMSKILEEKPGLGKTAMMKYVFLLQEVYKVPLGYDFEIYTYGPYSSEVMEDIDYARYQNIITIERVVYPTGHTGYNLSPSHNAEKALSEEQDFISEHSQSIKKVVVLFGDKTAKELELITTIIYLHGTYMTNGWQCTLETVSKNVHEIKPHFDIEKIKSEYLDLYNLGLLQQAV